MIEDWKTPRDKVELNIMWKYAKMSRYFCIGFFIMNRSTISTHSISHLSKPIQFLISDSNKTEEWPLYTIGSLPYNYKSHPQYELTIFSQYIAMVFASVSYDATDSFYCALMFHLVGQLSILKLRVQNLNKEVTTDLKYEPKFLSEFSSVHKIHTRLKRYSPFDV